jgi:hypothetical protein
MLGVGQHSEYLGWITQCPLSVVTVAWRVLRVPWLVLNGPDHRRERLRRAVSSMGKQTTAAAAAQPPAHAGERTLPGIVLSNPRWAARRIAVSLAVWATHAHQYTRTHGLRQTTAACLGAAMCGHCLPLLAIMPRLHSAQMGCSRSPRRCRAARPIAPAAGRCDRRLLMRGAACRRGPVPCPRGIACLNQPNQRTEAGLGFTHYAAANILRRRPTGGMLWRTITVPGCRGSAGARMPHARTSC